VNPSDFPEFKRRIVAVLAVAVLIIGFSYLAARDFIPAVALIVIAAILYWRR